MAGINHLRMLAAAAALVVGLGSFAWHAPTPAQAADLSQAQIDAGLKRFQAAASRASYFMSMEVAPEVTSAVPLQAGLHRLWDMKTAWKDVNPTQGVFDWSVLDARVAQAEASGARPLLVLGLTPAWAASDPTKGDARWGLGTASPPKNINDWKIYVSAVVSRYGNRIAAYEVWNEANLQTFWAGTFDQLAELTDTAYDIIKSSNSGALVLMASTTTRLVVPAAKFTAGYLEALGRYGNPFDGYTIHTYPAGDVAFDVISAQRIADVKHWQTAVVKAVGPDSPLLDRLIFDTEVNYGLAGPGTRPGTDFTDEQGATLLEQTYRDSAALGIDATFWFLYTAAPLEILGVQMWSGSPLVNAKWNALRNPVPTTPTPLATATPAPAPAPTATATLDAPINFLAARDGNHVKLTWDAPPGNLGATGITYNVQAKLCNRDRFDCSTAWVSFATAITSESLRRQVSWLDDTGVYEFRAQAANASAASPWSTTSRLVVANRVDRPKSVNAMASADGVLVTWAGSSLDYEFLEGYRIEVTEDDSEIWRVVGTFRTSRPFRGLSLAQLGVDAGKEVRFRVSTVATNGRRSGPSPPSPARVLTNELPPPTGFTATYNPAVGHMTITWTKPSTSAGAGARNVQGYEFEYRWPGRDSWTTWESPIGMDNGTVMVFDLVNVSPGVFGTRIRSIGWPGRIYSEFTAPAEITK